MNSWLHPFEQIKKQFFLSAAGVMDEKRADEEYVERLVRLARSARRFGPWQQHFLLAFDRWYDPNGRPRDDLTYLYVPNEYMWQVCQKYPDVFLPCISVHPYRHDAQDELEKWAQRGVRLVKWLPNSQGIDPMHPKCKPFYEVMKRWEMVLLCHVGHEHSVSSPAMDQELGNPLRLRIPLDAGVKVIAAHCASEGESKDLDHPQQPNVSSFELFLRLMNDPKYKKLLFADISSMTQFKRVGVPLTTMLDRDDLHPRLVFGTDYPLPGMKLTIWLNRLVSGRYITENEAKILAEIYTCNPNLFDFVCRRCIRSPNSGNTFPPFVYGWNESLFGPRKDFCPSLQIAQG